MDGYSIAPNSIKGLCSQDIAALQTKYGKNIFHVAPSRRFLHIVKDIVKEPMFILLLAACALYFVLGESSEGILMLVAMIVVSTIALYQEIKSSNAIHALKQYTTGKIPVIRDGLVVLLPVEELVPGDILQLEEGMTIPADALVLQQNDLSVNEAIITGESLPAFKDITDNNNKLFQGTTINTGKCVARVIATSDHTVLGKLGKAVSSYQSQKTLLQKQMNRFVRLFALFGLIAFFIVFLVNFFHYREWTTSLLFALTLAMSAIPEEIPVAFSSFMALGAYKMSRLGIISRQPQTIENLGAVNVICFDKTGTITENKMEVKTIYEFANDQLIDFAGMSGEAGKKLLRYAVLASEVNPFDSMEKAILESYHLILSDKDELPVMVHEYPLEGKPPMMTHVYNLDAGKTAFAKGATERVLRFCNLNASEKQKVISYVDSFASKGYRVLGVARALHGEKLLPASQDNFDWQFEGLVALYDPPKKNVPGVVKQFYQAHIAIKIITGDHAGTAINVAGQVGIRDHELCIKGDDVMDMENVKLKEVVKDVNVFARMFPEAKLKVIEALKANGDIVAMTGDGVNDGPALRSANIGIAMGKKGTEIAQQAADLVLTDDDLERLITALREGRKIFHNLKKAIRYIISIHVPIILVASLPLLLGWSLPNIFTPVHVIFLELIMGPTCSIFFEREPVELNLMQGQPRKRKSSLFTRSELFISIIQGIVITSGVLFLYYDFMTKEKPLEEIRTVVFITLIMSNLLLTFVNRSFTETIDRTLHYKNNLAPVVLTVSLLFLISILFVPAIRDLLLLSPISVGSFALCACSAFLTVFWFELYKKIFRQNIPSKKN